MSQDVDPYMLFNVARYGCLDDVRHLLENGPSMSNPCNGTFPATDPPDSVWHFISSSSSSCRSRNGPPPVDVTNFNGETALWLAAAQVHVVAIQTLIRSGANVNKSCNSRQTPLMVAAGIKLFDSDRQEKCVQLLLQAGADLHVQDDHGWTALMHAAATGSVNCVQLLLKAGAIVGLVNNEGKTALMIASCSGNYSCVEVLIKEPNCKINAVCYYGKTALTYAVAGFKKHCIELSLVDGFRRVDFSTLSIFRDCAKLLLEAGADVNIGDKGGITALMYVSSNDAMVDILRVMLQTDGIAVDQYDYLEATAVMHAVGNGSPQCLQTLINSGASAVNGAGYMQKTPLHYLFFEQPDVLQAEQCLKILLDNGANINATDDNGVTPLMQVSKKCLTPDSLALLVDHGANVNLVDREGRSALMYVLQRKNLLNCFESGMYLLENGADPNIKPFEGKSAVTFAIQTKHFSLLKLLIEYGAQLKVNWKRFEQILDSTCSNREILQLLIINGMMPTPRMPSTGEQNTYSVIHSALKNGSNIEDVMKYFIANSYLRNDDLSFISHRSSVNSLSPPDPFGHQSVQLLVAEMGSQPWPLVKMCFLTVSTLFGSSPGRRERIEKSQLPTKLQDMLMFKEPESRLCHHNWYDIPLTFNPQKYEKLPRPRPLLYNWPVGRRLVTCDCGQCDGTMYKYKEDD